MAKYVICGMGVAIIKYVYCNIVFLIIEYLNNNLPLKPIHSILLIIITRSLLRYYDKQEFNLDL